MYRKDCDNPQLSKIADYLRDSKEHAPYSPKDLDYHGLNLILHTLETLDIFNLQRNYKDKVIFAVHSEWKKIYETSFDRVRQEILKIARIYDYEHVRLK